MTATVRHACAAVQRVRRRRRAACRGSGARRALAAARGSAAARDARCGSAKGRSASAANAFPPACAAALCGHARSFDTPLGAPCGSARGSRACAPKGYPSRTAERARGAATVSACAAAAAAAPRERRRTWMSPPRRACSAVVSSPSSSAACGVRAAPQLCSRPDAPHAGRAEHSCAEAPAPRGRARTSGSSGCTRLRKAAGSSMAATPARQQRGACARSTASPCDAARPASAPPAPRARLPRRERLPARQSRLHARQGPASALRSPLQ